MQEIGYYSDPRENPTEPQTLRKIRNTSAVRYLGTISGTTTSSSTVSIGTLSIAAGTLEATDKIFCVQHGTMSGTTESGGSAVRLTINSTDFDFTSIPAGTTRHFFETFFATSNESSRIVLGMMHGTTVTGSSPSSRLNEANFGIDNALTQAITITLRAVSGGTETNSVKADFFVLKNQY